MGMMGTARLRYARLGPERSLFDKGDTLMSKNHDAKKNVKKAPTKTPQEKREAKRIKKAEKNK
jgi:hypothetical protein